MIQADTYFNLNIYVFQLIGSGSFRTIFEAISLQFKSNMYPSVFQITSTVNGTTTIVGDAGRLHYYQGVLIAEVALTLIVFLVLRIVHYVKWGYDEEAGVDSQKKVQEKKEVQSEATQSNKWDQKAWNVYFPIIFSFHIGAIALIIVYIPYIYSAVIGFFHFICFLVLIILNTCIKDKPEEEKLSRTKGTRVVWGIMCFFNIMLIIGGLTGVAPVYSG